MDSNPFGQMFNAATNPTKAEMNAEIKALVSLLQAHEERTKKTLVCFANILSDIPGNRETEKQKKYWEILERRLK